MLTRFGRLVIHAQTVRLDKGTGDQISPEYLKQFIGARHACEHLLVGLAFDRCHIEDEWAQTARIASCISHTEEHRPIPERRL
jgi:hypothetical protein